ncbi:MAG: hypothetical protein LBG62_00955 [Candidatus Methanoplasma sp.]|jgi:uncharacterized Zn finger protein|nr:hypothetical protein [Candidatus Methanoplasma sp.]
MNKIDPGSLIFVECPECGEATEHEILRGNLGKGNVTGTFKCLDCGRVFSGTVRIPEELTVAVVFSDGDVSEETVTTLESNEVVEVGDEFVLDDGRKVMVTLIDSQSGARSKSVQADKIKKLWVKQFGILSVKVSVNDGKATYPLRVEAEPDDEFSVGMTLSFDEIDALVHAIKTRDKILKRGSAPARDIVRVYGKARAKRYAVLDDEEDQPLFDE